MVGAERIELPTSCSQSKRDTAALRPENGCWWPVPISGYALRSMSRGPRLLIRVLSNRRHSYAVDSPTLNPCVTRAGFRHLRTRHRLTTQLRAVKSHPRFPAATEIPEVRYCAQGFNVGPPFVGHEPTTRSTEELLVDDRNRTGDPSLYQLSYTNIEAGRTTLNGDVQGDGLGKAISLPKASGSRHGAHLLFLRRILRTACAQENHWPKPFQRHREQNELLLEQTVSIFHFAQTLVHLSAWLLRSLWLEKLFDSF